MHLTRVPMSTSNLSIGMYVGMLDRPWLETPFLFQGFLIKDRTELEQLQSYCSQVYVEIERGKLTEAQIIAMAAGKAIRILGPDEAEPGKPGWLHRIVFRMGVGRFLSARKRKQSACYEITSTVRREAPLAKAAYEKCVISHRRIFERTRRSGRVDTARVIRAVTPLIQSILRNPNAMAWTVFSGKRSGKPYSRAVATSVLSVMFGRHLGIDRQGLQDLAVGGLLLDMGNVAVPDEILAAAGAITHDEYEQVPYHVQAGVDILHRSEDISPTIFEMVNYHHERYDGSGYPHGMRGSAIPAYGRIAAIVDCYDAMTTKSSYSPALAAYDAARELNDMRNRQFSAEVVQQFLHTIGMFPTGTVVELSDGSAGLVLEQNPVNLLQPKVLLLKKPSGEMNDKPKVLNSQEWKGSGIWISKGHEHGAFGINPMEYFN